MQATDDLLRRNLNPEVEYQSPVVTQKPSYAHSALRTPDPSFLLDKIQQQLVLSRSLVIGQILRDG
jgi:hypothetical protein